MNHSVEPKKYKPETSVISTGSKLDGNYRSVINPIYQTSNFEFESLGSSPDYDYTRSGNPNRSSLEEVIAELENGTGACSTSTGMSAIFSVFHLLKAGEKIISSAYLYGGTHRLIHRFTKQFEIELDLLDLTWQKDNKTYLENLKKSLSPKTKLVWLETPSNPLLQVIDLLEVCQVVKDYNPGILICVDNTFCSPIIQKPLDLGCDLVVHSTTKYLNGHSDVINGIVVSNKLELLAELRLIINSGGLSGSPFDAWLASRGIKTLPQRMRDHQVNALAIANFLNSHFAVKEVFYAGLKEHPQAEVIRQQMQGFGGMLSFKLDLEQVDLKQFFKKIKLFAWAVSCGGVESLIEQPWSMSHASMSEEDRKKAKIDQSLIRISAGIENKTDLIADLEQALSSCC